MYCAAPVTVISHSQAKPKLAGRPRLAASEWRRDVGDELENFDRLQNAYKVATDAWVTAIRQEEALVSAANHSIAEIDHWEAAHFHEDELRNTVKAAKKEYEDALRQKFFKF